MSETFLKHSALSEQRGDTHVEIYMSPIEQSGQGIRES